MTALKFAKWIYIIVVVTVTLGGDILAERQAEKEYDFVIVGGGTSGCIVASRLSENADHSILILEAGISDRDYPEIDIPQKMGRLQKTYIDWEFQTEPMKNCCKEFINKKSNWPIGKVLGGSSSHNYLDVVRGSPHDFDWWEKLGNKGWGFKDVLPYFIKAENNRNPKYATEFHGTEGPWTVETSDFTKLGQRIVTAAEELGYRQLDINGESSEGFDVVQLNTRYGRRMSTAAAYIWGRADKRKNLNILTEAFVRRIIFDGKTAAGVEYEYRGDIHTVYARKEIIIAAGAIMSPKILMHSGIGPKQHLEKFGIDLIADLPVGLGLEEHHATVIPFTTRESFSISEEKLQHPLAKFEYVFGGRGVYSTSGHQANGFQRSRYQPEQHKFPYLQYVYMGNLIGNHKAQEDTFVKMLGLDSNLFDFKHERGKDGIMVFVMHLHPRPSDGFPGTVKLRSNNYHDKPVINIEYLSHPDDVKDLIQGIRTQFKLMKTKTMQKIGTYFEAPHHKGCLQHEFDTDQYWECYLRHRTLAGYHPTSTCRMAPGDDGVVDNRLRVKGIKNLRVVDASVMPHMTSGNTMTPTIMIGEKGADMIKEDNA